jgi:type II secretory pathway component HofQ
MPKTPPSPSSPPVSASPCPRRFSPTAASLRVANTSVSVEYRDVLLKLEVVPLINSDDEVTLKIAQINDNIVGTQTISGNTVPTIGTQELVTEVAMKNGATVVLGGLITERVSEHRTRSHLPAPHSDLEAPVWHHQQRNQA